MCNFILKYFCRAFHNFFCPFGWTAYENCILLVFLFLEFHHFRFLSKSLQGSLCAARRAAAFVRGDDVIHKLFTELAYRYK